MSGILNCRVAERVGYSTDKRRRRRQHRRAAVRLRGAGDSTLAAVTRWHLLQARWLGR